MGSTATIGRDPEIGALRAALARLVDGRGSLVVIEGEAGIGKSHLVTALVAAAADCDVPATVCHAELLDQERAFHVVEPLIVRDERRRVGGDDRGLEAMLTDRYLAREAVVRHVEHAARTPAVFVFEDLHWADDASAAAIADAVRASTALPVLFTFTMRSTPRRAGLSRLLDIAGRRDDVCRLPLAALGPDEVVDLVASVGGVRTAALDRAVAAAGGNPFLVLEVARRWPAGAGRVPDLGDLPLLTGLSDDTLGVVRLASVLGKRFRTRTHVDVVGRDVDDALREAERGGILVRADDLHEFRHELIREAAYEDLGAGERIRAHRAAADSLVWLDPTSAADHLLIGVGAGDVDGARLMEDAARLLLGIDPDRALVLLDRADAVDDDLGRRLGRVEPRVRALGALGRIDEAVSAARSAEAFELSGSRFSRLREVSAGLALLRNRPDHAAAELDVAIAHADEDGQVARLTAQLALAHMAAGDPTAAAESGRSAVELAKQSGDAVAAALAHAVVGRLATFDHDYRRGFDLGRRAVAVADLDPTGEAHRWVPWLFVALTALDLDRLDDVREALVRGRQLTAGVPWSEPLFLCVEATVAARTGSLDDARSLAESAIDLSESIESAQASMWAHAIAGAAALDAGDADAARAHLSGVDRASVAGSVLGADHAVLLRSTVWELEGRMLDARSQLADAWAFFGAMSVRSAQPVLAAPLARLAAGDSLAGDVANEIAEAADRAEVPWLAALALRCRGLADGDPAPLLHAAEVLRGTTRPLELAQVLVEASRSSEAAGDVAAMRAEARRILSGHGARGLAARLGLDGDSVESPSDDGDWSRLTLTETAIVAMICEGLTNGEIAERRGVSRRTVESHLVRAYQKLGVSTRAQLIVLADGRFADRGA